MSKLCAVLFMVLALSSAMSAVQQSAESPLSGRWEAGNVRGGSPWIFDLVVHDGTVTGYVQQHGGELGPAEIFDGKADGAKATFKSRNPIAAKIAAFSMVVIGEQAQFSRSVEILPNGIVDNNAQTGQGAKYGVFGEWGPQQFTAVRVGPVPVPPIPPAPAGTPVNFTGVWESPQIQLDLWIFDLRAEGTTLTGTANFIGAPGRISSPRPVPIQNGKIEGSRISFRVSPADNNRSIVFTGVVQGDEIAFGKKVEVGPSGQFGVDGFFGAYTPSVFAARRMLPNSASAPMVKEIAEARAKWAARPPLYEFTIAWRCVCAYPREPITFRVNGSTPALQPNPSIEALDQKRILIERQGSIDQLFEILNGFANRHAHRLKIEFDPKLGYPTSAEIDFAGTTTFDDLGFTITNFRALN